VREEDCARCEDDLLAAEEQLRRVKELTSGRGSSSPRKTAARSW